MWGIFNLFYNRIDTNSVKSIAFQHFNFFGSFQHPISEYFAFGLRNQIDFVITEISAKVSMGPIFRGKFIPLVASSTTIPNEFSMYGEQRKHNPAVSTNR